MNKRFFYLKDITSNEFFDVWAKSLEDAVNILVNWIGGSPLNYTERF